MRFAQVLALTAVMCVLLQPGEASTPKQIKQFNNKWKAFAKKTKYKKWTRCNTKAVLKNPCECETIDCTEDGMATIIDLSNAGLQGKGKGKLPRAQLNQLVKFGLELLSIDLTGNPDMTAAEREDQCLSINNCVKPERSTITCSFDFDLCAPPTASPTEAPTPTPPPDLSAEWTAFYDATSGPSWARDAGDYATWPCTAGNGNGDIITANTKQLTCRNHHARIVRLRGQDMESASGQPVDVGLLEAFLNPAELIRLDLQNNINLEFDGCFDKAHTIMAPYGPLDASNSDHFTADMLSLCEVDAPEEDEVEAWKRLYDTTRGSKWDKCTRKRNDPSGCSRLTWRDGSIVEVEFDTDMGFLSADGDEAFQLLQFARALTALEVFDISGSPICFSDEYQTLLGCGDGENDVACIFHEECD